MADRESERRRLGKTLVQIAFWVLLGGTLGLAQADWRKLAPIPGPGGQVVATAVTSDGSRAATVTDDGHVSLWDLNQRSLIRTKHLPDGKPNHLAIRNQGDSIAVAYKDANALIWWCDSSDKVVRLNVRARLLAFAHQKRLLATVSKSTEFGATWDIDNGTEVSNSAWTSTQLTMLFLTVLPSDHGAIVHDFDLVGRSRGFGLEGEIEVYPSAGGGAYSPSQEIAYQTPEKRIVVHPFDGTNRWFTGIPRGGGPQTFNEQGTKTTRGPVCLIDTSYGSGKGQSFIGIGGSIMPSHLKRAPHYASITAPSGSIDWMITGNKTGDLLLIRPSKPNDWLYHPVTWLLTIFGVAFLIQIIARLAAISRADKSPPDPSDAEQPLPQSTRIAAVMIAIIGAITIVGMVVGVFFGGLDFNLMFLMLPAGIMVLKHRSNGWRKCGVFFIWGLMAVGGLMLGTPLLSDQPLEFTLGSDTGYLPNWAGILVGLLITAVGGFGWLALTDLRAKQICAAATYASKYDTEHQRRLALMTCPACGYDTRQTVIDGQDQCPECGRAISSTEEDRRWMTRRVDDWRKPKETKS